MPGKKTKTAKNFNAANQFAAKKKESRSKQVWIWDVPPQEREKTERGVIAAHPGIGHWEKIEDGRPSLSTP